MAQTSSSEKSRAAPKYMDPVELLHLAQRFIDMTLQPHQAAMLNDMIAAATVVPDDAVDDVSTVSVCVDTGATSAGTSFAASGAGPPVTVSVPPAYATQPPVSAAPLAPSASVSSSGGPVGSASAGTTAVQSAPVVVPLPSVTTSSSPVAVGSQGPVASTANAPGAAGTHGPVTLPVTNHGFAPYQVLPGDFQYVRPSYGTPGPYYAITRGRVVGVVAGWDKASPFCIGVGGAVFRSVPSLDAGRQVIETALNAGSCMILP